MSANDIEGMLQDYLDGRLPADRREEFEARIRKDAGLAERVRAASELRNLLRAEPDELPSGFYRRARERFEASRRPWAPLRTLVSWEAAGLAAAVLLLAAIVLPFALRSGLRVPETAGERTVPVKDELEEPAEGEVEEKAAGKGGRDTAPAVEDVKIEQDFAPAPPPEPVTPVPVVPERRDEAEPKKRAARLSAPEPQRSPEPEGPRISSQPEEPVEYDAVREYETDSFGLAEESREKSTAPKARSYRRTEGMAAESPAVPVRAVGLSPGAVDTGTVEVVASEVVWHRLLGRPGMEPAGTLRPDFSTERVVLVGPGERPVRCEEIFTRPEGGLLRIYLPEGGPGDPSQGCAVIVPLRPDPVEIRNVSVERAP